MKIKNKIISAVSLLTCLIVFSIFIFASSKLTKANIITDKEVLSGEKAEESAKTFINNIKPVEKKENFNDKFNKKSLVYDKNWKVNKWVMENDEIKIEVDDKLEPITLLNKIKTSQEKIKDSNKKIDKDQLRTKAKEISDKFAKEEKTLILEEDMQNQYKAYKWARIYKGYKYDNDFVLVTLDPSSGEIAGVSKRFLSKEPNINIKIDEIKAKNIAINDLSKIKDFEIGNIIKTEMLIVNPNYRWTDHATTEFISNTRLAYSITFEMIKPYNGELCIWIDAENGNILGGTITK